MNNIFDRNWVRYDDWYHRNEFVYTSEIEAIKRVLPSKGEGLEIGVGTGRFASPLGVKFGIDSSYNMIKVARKRGVKVAVARAEALPFKNEYFDYLLAVVTLSFVSDPERVLKEAGRVLKKEGYFVAGIIDKNSFLGKFYLTKKSIFYSQATLLGIEDVNNLLKSCGFSAPAYYQTIFDIPEKIRSPEKTEEGFGKGGFVVFASKKLSF
ncbi:MAG: methyltransferase domain-containing protein [Candidatus Omnitrophica bacterium]|nr:methyltransferase domain-containing protein [Candidatus Omnitrophota bacterium]MBD3269403.1 methyltransferase domain-containing protein [Candidatus Omnitrophota bacterium]